MLTAASSNTLLKTLEEPPAHVVFVLATTDPQKVLPTLRSRTQHFEFTLLSHQQLAEPFLRPHPRPGGDRDRSPRPSTSSSGASAVPRATHSRCSTSRSRWAAGSSTRSRCRPRSVGRPSISGSPCWRPRPAKTSRACSSGCASTPVALGHDVRRVADDLLRTLRDDSLQANASGRVPYEGRARRLRTADRAGQGDGQPPRSCVRSRSWAMPSSTSGARRSPTPASSSRSRSCASPDARLAPGRRRSSSGSSNWNNDSRTARAPRPRLPIVVPAVSV